MEDLEVLEDRIREFDSRLPSLTIEKLDVHAAPERFDHCVVVAVSNGSHRRRLEPKQCTSIAFGLRCKQAGVRPSMGSVADCYDNAMCESFFATLECELLDQKPLRTQAEARMAIFDFIDGWYNPLRRHSALGYQSPSAFERESRELGALPTNPVH